MTVTAESEVVDLCRELIRIDSSNFGDGSGPGERLAAEYVAEKLTEVGLEPVIVESAPGRANVLARWGNQNSPKPGLLIHGHLDVVPAQAADWKLHPFSGEVADGFVHGRGAVDMKDFDAMLLAVVRERQRAGNIPDRPITLAFTADEEAGSVQGANWLVEHHRDWFEGCTEAIGEVGGFSVDVRGQRLYLIEAAEKGISWLRLTATGTAGHGSMRNDDNAVNHLARALVRLADHEWPIEPGPAMRQLLATITEITGETAEPLEQLAELGPAVRMLASGVRNTLNTTMLTAGYKHNVIPGLASANVDGRFLPGHESSFMATIKELAGPNVEVEQAIGARALEYEFSGDLVDAMTLALHQNDPGAHVAPYLMSGGTDAKAWDRLGITGFGFAPLRLPGDLDFTALFHGVDERVPVDALQFGARVLNDFLEQL